MALVKKWILRADGIKQRYSVNLKKFNKKYKKTGDFKNRANVWQIKRKIGAPPIFKIFNYKFAIYINYEGSERYNAKYWELTLEWATSKTEKEIEVLRDRIIEDTLGPWALIGNRTLAFSEKSPALAEDSVISWKAVCANRRDDLRGALKHSGELDAGVLN